MQDGGSVRGDSIIRHGAEYGPSESNLEAYVRKQYTARELKQIKNNKMSTSFPECQVLTKYERS